MGPLLAAALTAGGGSLSAQTAVRSVVIDSSDVRPVFEKLWRASLEGNKEFVACIGGERVGRAFRITRAAALYSLVSPSERSERNPEMDSDSMSVSRYLSEVSVETCRPPQWVGTIHTHRIERGIEYPRLSSGDRAVISLWHGRWRHESVFCVLFSLDKPPYCEYQPGADGAAAGAR